MGKIEEIKGRVSQNALHQAEWTENYRGDVQYLLSRLEIAEEALKDLAKNSERSYTLSEVEGIALGALEQIQKE